MSCVLVPLLDTEQPLNMSQSLGFGANSVTYSERPRPCLCTFSFHSSPMDFKMEIQESNEITIHESISQMLNGSLIKPIANGREISLMGHIQ